MACEPRVVEEARAERADRASSPGAPVARGQVAPVPVAGNGSSPNGAAEAAIVRVATVGEQRESEYSARRSN
jgi:hypothetical protein